jgi:hypothetical protein
MLKIFTYGNSFHSAPDEIAGSALQQDQFDANSPQAEKSSKIVPLARHFLEGSLFSTGSDAFISLEPKSRVSGEKPIKLFLLARQSAGAPMRFMMVGQRTL